MIARELVGCVNDIIIIHSYKLTINIAGLKCFKVYK